MIQFYKINNFNNVKMINQFQVLVIKIMILSNKKWSNKKAYHKVKIIMIMILMIMKMRMKIHMLNYLVIKKC